MHEETLKSLPCVGARLVRLRFRGNGKDSEVTLQAEGHRRVTIPLSDARLDLSCSGPISMRMEGCGDTEVVWEIAPTAEQVIRIEEATIEFPLTVEEDEWEESFRSLKDEGTLDWAVTLRLKLNCRA